MYQKWLLSAYQRQPDSLHVLMQDVYLYLPPGMALISSGRLSLIRICGHKVTAVHADGNVGTPHIAFPVSGIRVVWCSLEVGGEDIFHIFNGDFSFRNHAPWNIVGIWCEICSAGWHPSAMCRDPGSGPYTMHEVYCKRGRNHHGCRKASLWIEERRP